MALSPEPLLGLCTLSVWVYSNHRPSAELDNPMPTNLPYCS